MPIYEYSCKKCGKHIEIIQKFSDKLLRTCPDCKGRLSKLISRTSFQLKGTGWYVTDYARKAETEQKSSESKSESKSDSDKSNTNSKNEKHKKPSSSSSKSEKPSISKKK
mgnify:CR=1 FL=1